jgi:hypothetical protein
MQEIARFEGRAAEHVGQDGDAVTGVDALDRFDDVLAALLHIVVRADGDSLDLGLRADDVLQRSAKLDGEPPVGDKDKTNHRLEAPAGAVAPHEWAAIIMIQSPSSRARGPIIVGCCTAVNGHAGGFQRRAVNPHICGFAGISMPPALPQSGKTSGGLQISQHHG